MEDEVQRAVDRAMRALARRAHSEREIVEKLTQAGFDEHVMAQAMARLAEYRYINDNDFARQWAAMRTRRGMGPWRIRHELREKGVDQEIIDAVLAELDEDESLEKAAALAEKHLRRGDDNARKRAFDAMVRRGYSYETARKALAAAEAELAEEDDGAEDE